MLSARIPSPLLVMAALLTGLACTPPGVEASRANALRAYLDDWKGKPFADFLQATRWQPNYDRTAARAGAFRVVGFIVLDSAAAPATSTTMTYHQVTPWTDNRPGASFTGGANQPLGAPPTNANVRTETVRMPESSPGCTLWVWVDGTGQISSWRLEGNDCTRETLDRLKQH